MTSVLSDPLIIAKNVDGNLTFPAFNSSKEQYGLEPTRRLDYCFVNGQAMVVDHFKVIRDLVDGMSCSDHYGLYLESRINVAAG